MKRYSFLIAFFTLAFAACGGGDQPAPQAPELAQPEQAATEMPAEATGETVADEEVQPEMVEESAAEEEPAEDKPIVLAQTEAPQAPAEWKFTEGTNYVRLVPTQPTVGGADKIEVAEIFWYGCGHCYDFEAFINRWKETIPPNVRFVRIPAVWNPLVQLHAQLYYTEQVLVTNGKIAEPDAFRAAVFAEYHRRGNRLASVDVIRELFTKHGVSAEDFDKTWGSFEVSQKVRVAQDLGRRYGVSGVPTIVVNGKYRTGAGEAGGYPKLLELIDELIVRESLR